MMSLTKITKLSFLFFFFLTFYFAFVWFVLPFLADPRLSSFEKYHRLWNWDLRQHARGDFDNDGKEDLISFTGCAFLSSVEPNKIPSQQTCTATGIADLFLKNNENKIGQKYLETDIYDLNLSALDKKELIYHSYLGKNNNENWKIFINSNYGLQIYDIEENGLLSKESKATFFNHLDEFLYKLSNYFVLLALPLIPLAFIFGFIFNRFRSINDLAPIYEVITLGLITATLYWLWKKMNKQKSTNHRASKPLRQ